ncbi:hypothetical protein QCA50_017332 [Cerrena zonata]|uniref:Uncharacterized protein n=1 Tax=Cerrena zonata TaxID=2478898 RepID=A0AAW0FQM4_9APHY
MGIDMVFGPISTYYVDVLHNQSSEVMAATMALRGTLIAISSSTFLTLIDNIGIVWTNAIAAALSWIAYLMIWCVIRYGPQMRAFVDVGFSTVRDN